jgi:hypothetical protein
VMMKIYFFLCDSTTEDECLKRQLVGTTSTNVEWALKITPGDLIVMYNFHTADILGPFTATSAADCHEPRAWNSRFPVQVRVAKTLASRRGKLLNAAEGKKFLTSRGSRPPHVLEEPLASSLLSWIASEGKEF